MPTLTMVKPWDVSLVMNTLYRLYAEQKGLPPATVIVTPKKAPAGSAGGEGTDR